MASTLLGIAFLFFAIGVYGCCRPNNRLGVTIFFAIFSVILGLTVGISVIISFYREMLV